MCRDCGLLRQEGRRWGMLVTTITRCCASSVGCGQNASLGKKCIMATGRPKMLRALMPRGHHTTPASMITCVVRLHAVISILKEVVGEWQRYDAAREQTLSRIINVKHTCMMIRRSALPVRISYSVNDRSEPMLANTDASDRLKRTAVTVSVEVGRVKFDTAALLRKGCELSTMARGNVPEERTLFHPTLAPG